jgi:hypothetical protein
VQFASYSAKETKLTRSVVDFIWMLTFEDFYVVQRSHTDLFIRKIFEGRMTTLWRGKTTWQNIQTVYDLI